MKDGLQRTGHYSQLRARADTCSLPTRVCGGNHAYRYARLRCSVETSALSRLISPPKADE